ncbi:MAG: serine hydrolase, partial [Bacteroidota bacterium]
MNLHHFLLAISMLATTSLPAQKKLLSKLLHQNDSLLSEVLKRPEQFDVQVIYTQIDRDENNLPLFTSHTYQLNEKQYFYPASTVKMPTAFLALEKLNRLKIKGLDKYSTMKTGAGSPPQTPAETDSTAENGLPSVAHYVKKIFLVSDNDAHNRLYEFLGQTQLNEALWAKGYRNLRIVHRLGISGFDAEANRQTNPVSFFDGDTLLYFQNEVYGQAGRSFQLDKTLRGKGYFSGDSLVNQPFDFSQKNYFSLRDFHDVLRAVIFPEATPAEKRFDLSEDDYRFLYRVMSELPRESQFPKYDHEPDHYCKFFLFGDRKKEEKMPANIRIFNKPGWAYGFLTDVAYIVDFENQVEFFLAATIHVNEDGIFNDDNY